jgi:hypothetical protein
VKYGDLIEQLRTAYDARVEERERLTLYDWKQAERSRFLARLLAADKHTLLEVGAGTGVHGRWFADAGLAVTCTDLSPPEDLHAVLQSIRGVLIPGALVYVGQYGGTDWQGINEDDDYEPKRYFSLLSDERLQEVMEQVFTVLEFRTVSISNRPNAWQFHSVIAAVADSA